MNSELHKYLVEVDELGNWEFPKDGCWDTPFKEIKAVKENIENIIGSSLDLDSNVQDASFLTDLGILDERYQEWEKGIITYTYLFSFRFSNFGSMFTVYGSEWPQCGTKYHLSEAIEFLESKNYKYIPKLELSELYDGVNKPYEQGLTWWTRYFDYL